MDGVTILNTFMEWNKGDTAFILFSGMFLATAIILGIVAIANDMPLIGCLTCGLSVFLLILLFNIPKTEHIQAMIDDSVSWVELTDKYEIIKSEGRIITMIEKERVDEQSISDRR